jgi:hypothetical protein
LTDAQDDAFNHKTRLLKMLGNEEADKADFAMVFVQQHDLLCQNAANLRSELCKAQDDALKESQVSPCSLSVLNV